MTEKNFSQDTANWARRVFGQTTIGNRREVVAQFRQGFGTTDGEYIGATQGFCQIRRVRSAGGCGILLERAQSR